MNRLLPSLITTSAIVLSFAFAGTASAADAYDVMSDCSISAYVAQDKCGLSIHLGEDFLSKTSLKKIIFRVNGKPVHVAYNDKTPLQTGNTFSAFSLANQIPVTCGKTYTISASVVTATSVAETKVGEPQPVICPAKATF
jgi:hypothetical protein